MDENEIKKLIYSEAGQACRSHEFTTRTTILVFAAIQTAIFGFIQNEGLLCRSNIIIELISIYISIVIFLIIRRQRLYYKSYIKQAKIIELEFSPKFQLYTRAFKSVHKVTKKKTQCHIKILNHIPESLKLSHDKFEALYSKYAKNKNLLASIPAIFFIGYIVLILIQLIFGNCVTK